MITPESPIGGELPSAQQNENQENADEGQSLEGDLAGTTQNFKTE